MYMLLLGNYNPPSQNGLSFINELNLALNFLAQYMKTLFCLEISTCPQKTLI